MRENLGEQIEKVSEAGTSMVNSVLKKNVIEDDTDVVDAQRSGRTNTARDMRSGTRPTPGRWDSIGEEGEGLDELQAHYTGDSASRDHLTERRDTSSFAVSGSSSPTADAVAPTVWDQLGELEGKTVETPKGEPFRVEAVSRTEGVTVSPLDGGHKWNVPAQELERAWIAVDRGVQLDGLASIRLQEAGVASVHPEYVAGLLQVIAGNKP